MILVVRRYSCLTVVLLGFLAALMLGIDRNAVSKRNEMLLSESILLEQQIDEVQASLPILKTAAEEVVRLSDNNFGLGDESEEWRRDYLQRATPLGDFKMNLQFDGISNMLSREKKPWNLYRDLEVVPLGLVPFRVTVEVVADLEQIEYFIASLDRSSPAMIVRQLSLEKEESTGLYTTFLDLAFPVFQYTEALDRITAFATKELEK